MLCLGVPGSSSDPEDQFQPDSCLNSTLCHPYFHTCDVLIAKEVLSVRAKSTQCRQRFESSVSFSVLTDSYQCQYAHCYLVRLRKAWSGLLAFSEITSLSEALSLFCSSAIRVKKSSKCATNYRRPAPCTPLLNSTMSF